MLEIVQSEDSTQCQVESCRQQTQIRTETDVHKFQAGTSSWKGGAKQSNSGGSRGHHWCMPPYGPRFFCFDIQIFQNVATSGVAPPPPYEVGAPPTRSAPPPTGNPGSATGTSKENKSNSLKTRSSGKKKILFYVW